MDRFEAMLANAKSIEAHGKVLQAKGMRALADKYFVQAGKLRAEAAVIRQPLPLAA